MFQVKPFSYDDCLHVCRNTRPEDVRQLLAVRGTVQSAEGMAADCELVSDWTHIAYCGDEPVAVIGAIPMHPGVFQAFMFATKRFPDIAAPLTEWARDHYLTDLRERGAHRVECCALENLGELHCWIEAAGMNKEALIPCYGKNREDFIKFARLWDEEDVRVQRA